MKKIYILFLAMLISVLSFGQSKNSTIEEENAYLEYLNNKTTEAESTVSLKSAMLLLSNETTVNYTGSFETYTVPPGVTSINIEAFGAQGASGDPSYIGGKGAKMSGDFNVTPGDVLIIAVGGQGQGQSSYSNGGGGGGTFVVRQNPTGAYTFASGLFAGTSFDPLIIAGGGGGTRVAAQQNGNPGVISQQGTTGSSYYPTGGGLPNSVSLGGGGLAPAYSWGSAGGGLTGNGANDYYYGFGGSSFINGAAGGTGGSGGGDNAAGGFGGGGQGRGYYGGGGGGGYTGGDGGWIAGGGGSFNAGFNQNNLAGINLGNGKVLITILCPDDITVNNDAGQCGAIVEYNAPSGLQTAGLPSGSVFPVGTTTNTFDSGCSFTVTVNDTEDPVFSSLPTISSPVTLNYADRMITYSGVSINGAGNAAFVAPGALVSLSYNMSVYFNSSTGYCPGCVVQSYIGIGTTGETVQCERRIFNGYSANHQGINFNAPLIPGTYFLTQQGSLDYQCNPMTFNNDLANAIGVIVVGSAPVPSDILVSNDLGVCGAKVSWTVPTASDNCGIATLISTNNPGDLFPVGKTTVTYTATDVNGYSVTESFDVTVNDTEAPVIICPADIISDNDPGKCDAVVSFSLPSVTDNCLFPAENLTGFTSLGVYNGNTYYLSNALFLGPNAFADAVSKGGFLASINSEQENTFVRNAANSVAGAINILIGFNDVQTEGTFVWQNGDPVSYTNWNGGEPNDAGGEDYTEILPTGKWNDVPGYYYTYRYVLELKGSLVQTAGLPSGSVFPEGTTTNTFLATDGSGNTATCSFTVTVNNTLPEVTIVTGPATPVALGNSISLSIGHNDNNLTNATIDWDDLTPIENVVNPATGSFNASHTYATPGVYTVSVTLTDACGEVSETYHYQYVVIYDPNGGFVTGGGWFWSEACAYKDAEGVSGRANFGFVAKYKKGSTVPDGNTEFQFKAGDLNFHSSQYDDMRLVIAGARANYKGVGYIKGSDHLYGFMVSVIDGNVSGGGGTDKFRIKIWDKDDNDRIVYDNNCIETDENSDPATAIGGGSIVIHSTKTKSAEIATAIEPEVGFSELKAYPNPFSDKLFFEFSREVDSKATLILFDGVGRKISVLFDQQIEANQNYRIEYVPNGLSTNMLFYRMTFDNEVINGKVIYKK